MKCNKYILLSFLQLVIFAFLWYYYFTHPLFKCPCKKYNHGFPIAKSSAILININILFILISISKIYKKFIYINDIILKSLHVYIAISIIFWSLLHSISHYINFVNNKMSNLLLSGVGITGNLLIIFISVIILSSYIKSNKSYFYIIHNISTILFIITICFHGTFCTIKYNVNTCPDLQSWKWLLSGLIIILIEKFYKYLFVFKSSSIINISNNLYQITLKLSQKYCGKIIFINVPKINRFEWHPFIISSYNKTTSDVSIHIKNNGDWTSKFIDILNNNDLNHIPINIKIDGPYYHLPKNFNKKLLNEPSLLITSGIGITTFSYNLQQLSKETTFLKLYLIIIVKSPNDIAWFIPTLKLLFDKNNVHILFYFTDVFQDNLYSKNNIVFPFNFNYGRPNFNNILESFFISNLFNKPNSLINIYFSGNKEILKDLKKIITNNKTFILNHY